MRLTSTIFVLVLCTIQKIACDNDATLVKIEQGWIRGEKLNTVVGNCNYFSYKGIPYAKPPTGKLRFKAPEKAEPWDGVLNATKHGNVCPQFNPINGVITSGSENCLFLNVYSPNINPKSLYSVIFFIHGGANMFGSGDTDLYGPDFLVDKNVVVVTINYRLAALGFLSMGNKEVSGNAALKDQVLALKWVQNNIASFGGNPESVTIFGETAGGQAVTLHMMSPMSKGLFHNAVAMSGSPTCDYGLTYKPEIRAKIFGKLNNCTDVENDTALLTCLQEAPYYNFHTIHPTVMSAEENNNVLFKMEDFAPVIEKNTGNNFLTEDYYTMLTNGNVNKDVAFMYGYASKEALLLIDFYINKYIVQFDRNPEMFAPSEILMKCTPDTVLKVADKVVKYYFGNKKVTVDNLDSFVNYASNASIAYHAHRFSNKWAPWGNKTYAFKVDYFTDWNVYGQQGAKYGINGTAHFDLVFYSFYASSLNRPVNTDSLEYKLSQKFTTALTNFAKTRDPSIEGAEWLQYSPSYKNFMTFTNDGLKPGCGPDENDYKFWEGIYKCAGVPF